VLILCDIEDHSYEEIAEFMQTPVGTIRSRLHRGRKLLAGRLRDYARARGQSSQLSSTRN
jgi:RNA polymerase sigma-70 factor (ECF subfamily)